jgi:hypothetical protein
VIKLVAPHDVHHRNALRQQIVGNDAALAAPPHSSARMMAQQLLFEKSHDAGLHRSNCQSDVLIRP